MYLNAAIFVIICVIVYFHYLQGFFSAAISAFLAVVAAMIAMAFHEKIVEWLLGGKMADYANTLALIGLFALSYFVLRVAFDRLVPGNVRLPLIVDKVGAAAMGVVAAVFSVGVLVIAAQALPFEAAIGGWERYPIKYGLTTSVKPPGTYSDQDATYDELDSAKFTENEANGLWVPVDSAVQGLMRLVSDNAGALSSGAHYSDSHPDYMQELFGQRVGLQLGSKHAAAVGKTSVLGVYGASKLKQQDPERFQTPGGTSNMGARGKDRFQGQAAEPALPELPPERLPGPNKALVIVRVKFDNADADAGGKFAFSAASTRLAAPHDGKFTNYFPIGTMEGPILYVAMPEDYLFTAPGGGADIVFEVDTDALIVAENRRTLAPGTFVEVKRLARVDLGGKALADFSTAPNNAAVRMVRKGGEQAAQAGTPTEHTQAAPPLAKDSTLGHVGTPTVSIALGTAINLPNGIADTDGGIANWGGYALRSGKFSHLSLEPPSGMRLMTMGPNLVSEFAVPGGKKLVQVPARPATENVWAWANDLASFKVVDLDGKTYACAGAIAKAIDNGQNMLRVYYDAEQPADAVATDDTIRNSTQATDVILLFLVPNGTDLKSVNYKNEVLQPFQLKAQ